MKAVIVRILSFIILLPIRLLSLLFLVVVNFFYPIFDLLLNKFQLFNLQTIKPEHQDNIDLTLKNFSDDFGIEVENQQQFLNLICKLATVEKTYIYDIQEKEFCYFRIRYVFHIIELAKYALFELNRISKDNKTIGYYEDTKYSSINNLIKEFQAKLDARGHEQIFIKQARREIQFKRLFAKMKKHNRLFFNFYLMMFTLYPIDNMKSKISKEDMDIFEFMINVFSFYSIGHATPNQIYKSVAIQIYKYYQNDFTKDELENIISELIDLCFQTDSPYTNFNNIDQEPYIKNLVASFPLFECNNDLSLKQYTKVKRFFLAKNLLIPRWVPKFLQRFIINRYIQKPLQYYQKHAFLTFFGFMQRNF